MNLIRHRRVRSSAKSFKRILPAYISFTSVDNHSIDDTMSISAVVYNINVQGDRAYLSLGTGGVGIVDISDPTSLTTLSRVNNVVSSSFTVCRGSVLIGSTLITCARGGATEGVITTWDVSADEVGVPEGTALDTFESASEAAITDASYSMIDTDYVDHVYVLSQLEGIEAFDISTPSAISRTDIVDDSDYETQGGTLHDGYLYACNYGSDGLGAGVTSDIRTHTVSGGTVGTPANTDSHNYNGTNVRAWDAQAVNDYLFVCFTEGGGAGTPAYSGLGIYDISTPGADLPLLSYAPIPTADMGELLGDGDRPSLAIKVHGKYAFLANGTKGVAVYYVEDRTRPIYLGTFGNHDSGDAIGSVDVFDIGSQMYVLYGSYTLAATPYVRKLYCDKVNVS